jgi:2-methylcitrate dehydratase PrpD
MLAARGRLEVDDELDMMFSEAVPARMMIATASGDFSHTVAAPKGEPSNPLSRPDLETELETATRHLAEVSLISSLLVEAIDAGDLARSSMLWPCR